MSTTWVDTLNLAKNDKGSQRSILGYAGESLVIGRALVCGYNLFFKAWRDSKYDAVLDYRGSLYRIEIKQFGKAQTSVSTTSGGRSGEQISRAARSRAQVLSVTDCDFLIAVESLSGKCWIVPTEFIEILGKPRLTVSALTPFSENWSLFMNSHRYVNADGRSSPLRHRSIEELKKLHADIGLSGTPPSSFQPTRRHKAIEIESQRDRLALAIWIQHAQLANVKSRGIR